MCPVPSHMPGSLPVTQRFESLKSLQVVIQGTTIRVITGDARSLGYSSCGWLSKSWSLFGSLL